MRTRTKGHPTNPKIMRQTCLSLLVGGPTHYYYPIMPPLARQKALWSAAAAKQYLKGSLAACHANPGRSTYLF